jgi:choline dehydrogenase-like flavoprotein
VKPCTEGLNKWSVFFAWHGDKRDAFKTSIFTELMWVQAREFVFLGAGSLGTTEILLRSREYGLPLSHQVGLNMSGNGDILAFGYNGEKTANAIGTDDKAYLAKHPVGPTINGIIDMRDEEVAPHPRDGFVIEEGAVPKALAHVLHAMYTVTSGKRMPTGLAIRERLDELAGTLTGDLFGPWGHHSSLNRTMIYLIMSHDDNQGSMCLDKNQPSLQFSGVEHSIRVQQIDKLLQDAMGKIGAEYIPNPFTSKKFGRSEISVHPLGGANMSPDGTGMMGATNHLGQVFKGSGKEVYEGLVVVDAACIPAALGVNPFATITALAERSVETLARQKGWEIDYTLPKGNPFPEGWLTIS